MKAAGAYFVTSRTWESRKLFQNLAWAELLVQTLMDYRNKHCYELHDFVVMPDHFHIIMTPGREYSLEKAVQMVKGGSSRRIGKQFQTQFSIWQKGFHEHWIRSRDDYEARKRYIEQNPVKARLAVRPSDYPYSSANGKFCLDPVTMTSAAEAAETSDKASAGLKPRPAKAGQNKANDNR